MSLLSSSNWFVTETDGYYKFTSNGLIAVVAIAIVIAIVAILLKNVLLKKNDESVELSNKDEKKKEITKKRKSFMTTKQIVVCGICIALAFATSYVKFLEMPYGGSITLFSMFFITYIAYCFGTPIGFMCGLAYGVMQMVQDPWLLSPLQVFFDYIFAFAALGLGGVFRNLKTKNKETGETKLSKSGLITVYLVGAILRGISHVIGGYMFWMDSMPDNFPKSFSAIYPFVYNFSFIGAEAILTTIVLLIPGVAKVLISLRREANS